MNMKHALQLVTGSVALSLLIGTATSHLVISSATAQVQPTLPSNTELAAPTRAEAQELVTQSQQQLRELPSRSQIAQIKNQRVRDAALDAYQAMQNLANTDARDVRKVDVNYQQFERAYAVLQTVAQTGGPQTCTFKCKEDSKSCQGACKKKHCGCKFSAFGCIVAAWFHGTC